MPKLMVSTLVLVVAIVGLAGLAFQTVPMSTTRTITQESTEHVASYSPYIVTYIFTTAYSTITYSLWNWQCSTPIPGQVPQCSNLVGSWTTWANGLVAIGITQRQDSTSILYTQTVTSSITESSTNIVPAYSSIGLNAASFVVISVLVICILVLVTVWIALKSKPSHMTKLATMSGFMKSSHTCVKCGIKLSLKSTFCDRCGTKQP